jgi:membrane-bound serine protease (ClpP class)
MKLLTVLVLCSLVIAAVIPQSQAVPTRQAFVLDINGVISPATADYVERAFDKANQANTEFILLRMDTPGGLDLSMRSIIKKILASPIPVVTYVSPGGARAASAGTYILYASHVAAMTPGTNLGAATPVQMIPSAPTLPNEKPPLQKENETDNKNLSNQAQDPMSKKIINDAVAYIKSLAVLRNRNAQWAEQAVRAAASLPAKEALEKNVIDIVAISRTDLFRQLDNRKIKILGEEKTLTTQDLTVSEILPDWRNKLLDTITNPNVAYILMLIGIYGIIFEFSSPGAVVPGTVGAISLLLALFAFQVLPINYAGLSLVILGISLMTAEAFQPSFGVLGLGGIVAFASGSIILIDTDVPGYGIDLGVIAGFTVTTSAFFIMALGLVFKARRHPIVSGQEQMIGAHCVALEDFEQRGRVLVHSEVWHALASKPMKKGDGASVQSRDGLILTIIPHH